MMAMLLLLLLLLLLSLMLTDVVVESLVLRAVLGKHFLLREAINCAAKVVEVETIRIEASLAP